MLSRFSFSGALALGCGFMAAAAVGQPVLSSACLAASLACLGIGLLLLAVEEG